jgi:hypothetical protein
MLLQLHITEAQQAMHEVFQCFFKKEAYRAVKKERMEKRKGALLQVQMISKMGVAGLLAASAALFAAPVDARENGDRTRYPLVSPSIMSQVSPIISGQQLGNTTAS